jgi:hypothetical protein
MSVALTLAVLFTLIVGAAPASAGDGGIAGGSYSAALVGAEETPPVTTGATGEFQLTIVDASTWLYTLSYRGFEGGDPLFAHIHIGPAGGAGPVVIPLCGAGGKPNCPSAGSVSGTITPADVMALPDLGVAAGDLNRVLGEMRSGNTYANAHNPQNPGGHIRGQISGG